MDEADTRTHLTRALPSSGRERLRLFDAVSENLSDAELLSFALQHAVAHLGGLGGLAHRRGTHDQALRLAAVSGLPREMAQVWEKLAWDDPACPARAAREAKLLWLPIAQCVPPATTNGQMAFAQGTGLAAVPLRDPDQTSDQSPDQSFDQSSDQSSDRILGVLTILTTDPHGPDPEQREFLEALADTVGTRLQEARRSPAILSPTWWQVPTGSGPQQAVRPSSVGAWEWDIRTGVLLADEATLKVGGIAPETYVASVQTWSELIHPDDTAVVLAEVERSIAEHNAYSVEYRIRRPDGNLVWVEARAHITYSERGEPLRMTGTLWETTETRMERDAVGRALRLMSDGFLAVDDEWRILYCNIEAKRVLGTSGKLLGRVLWDAVPDIGAFGLQERYRQAVVGDAPVGFDVQAPANNRWYHMRLVPVPGALTVYFTDVTEARAQRAEQAEAARASAERTARMGALTDALALAVTSQDVVNAVADQVLPLFGATGLLMDAVDGDRLRAVGAVGYRQSFVDRLDGIRVEETTPGHEALLNHAPRFIRSPEEFTSLYPNLELIHQAGGKQAWAFVPLIASGRSVGLCVISFDEPRVLNEDERDLLVAFSGMAAHAFERARLYDAEHSRAQELQRGMLPQTLPVLPAVTVAARYLPAGAGMEVGGDWYDVIPLASERVALVIGDVMGHGLSEAVTMGRLRTAVHTLADLELPPGELLARINDLVNDLGDSFYATCLYAIYDPTTRELTYSAAGHPPPAVVHADGGVHFPDQDPDPPLGVASPPFATVELVLPQESIVVLYTDGLVESAYSDIESGMAHLARTLRDAVPPIMQRSAGHPHDVVHIENLCDTITATLLPQGGQLGDDAALLVARTHALAPQDIASWTLPDDAIAAGQARRHANSQLSEWQLDELTMTTELLVSELVGNVVRHAKGPIRLRMLRGRTLVCEVYDGSLATPRIRHASETDEGGRGLQLVAALSHRWGARHTNTGKCIWTEQLRI